jgi:hypothetical protein
MAGYAIFTKFFTRKYQIWHERCYFNEDMFGEFMRPYQPESIPLYAVTGPLSPGRRFFIRLSADRRLS